MAQVALIPPPPPPPPTTPPTHQTQRKREQTTTPKQRTLCLGTGIIHCNPRLLFFPSLSSRSGGCEHLCGLPSGFLWCFANNVPTTAEVVFSRCPWMMPVGSTQAAITPALSPPCHALPRSLTAPYKAFPCSPRPALLSLTHSLQRPNPPKCFVSCCATSSASFSSEISRWASLYLAVLRVYRSGHDLYSIDTSDLLITTRFNSRSFRTHLDVVPPCDLFALCFC